MDEVATVIRPIFNTEASYVIFIAAALIFILTLIVVQIIDYLAARFIKIVRLRTINSVLGFFFGLLKGAIIVSAVLILLAGFQYPSKQARDDSATYSYIIVVAPWAYNLVSDKNFTHTIEEALQDMTDNFPVLKE